jgi:hypothetical protein
VVEQWTVVAVGDAAHEDVETENEKNSVVTWIVEHSEQCLIESDITEEVNETPVQAEQPGFTREQEPRQPIALSSVHRSLFRPPQHLLYGFTPVMPEKWENFQSYTRKEFHQSNAEPKQDNT